MCNPEENEERVREVALAKALTKAVNSVSAENGSDTPDFILGDFLAAQLQAFNEAVHRRSQWYGHHQSISSGSEMTDTRTLTPQDEEFWRCARHGILRCGGCDSPLKRWEFEQRWREKETVWGCWAVLEGPSILASWGDDDPHAERKARAFHAAYPDTSRVVRVGIVP